MKFQALIKKVGFPIAFGLISNQLSAEELAVISINDLVSAYNHLEFDPVSREAIVKILKHREADFSAWRTAYQIFHSEHRWELSDSMELLLQAKQLESADVEQLIFLSSHVAYSLGGGGQAKHDQKFASAVAQKATTWKHWMFVFNRDSSHRDYAFGKLIEIAHGFGQRLWIFRMIRDKETEFTKVARLAKTVGQLLALYEACPEYEYDRSCKPAEWIEIGPMKRKIMQKLRKAKGNPHDWTGGQYGYDEEMKSLMVQKLRESAGSVADWAKIYLDSKESGRYEIKKIAMEKLEATNAPVEEWHEVYLRAKEAKNNDLAKTAYMKMKEVVTAQ